MRPVFFLPLLLGMCILPTSCREESDSSKTTVSEETNNSNKTLQASPDYSVQSLPPSSPHTPSKALVKAGGHVPDFPELRLKLPNYHQAQKYYQERCHQDFENNYYNPGIYSKETTDCPIRYKKSLSDDLNSGIIHIINGECILKDMDIWDTKSLEYVLSLPYSEQVQGFSYPFYESKQKYWLYQYDNQQQSLGIRFRSRGKAGNGVRPNRIFGEYCYGVNLKNLEYEAAFKFLGSNIYLTPRSIGDVFQKESLKCLTDISTPMRMLHTEAPCDMESHPLLKPLRNKQEKSVILTPCDIDAQHLKVKISQNKPIYTNNIYTNFNFDENTSLPRNIPGLPNSSDYEWEHFVFKPKGCRGYDIVEAAQRGEIYLYCKEEKLLIRLWDCEGYSPGFEVPDEYSLGYSDMGVRTLSCSNRLIRGEPNQWLSPQQAITEDLLGCINLVYSDSKDAMQEWSPERKKLPTIFFDASSDYAHAEQYSLWNRVPGEQHKAYWIAVGNDGCSFFLIDMAAGTGKLIQRWYTEGKVFFIPERNWLCFEKGENGWEVLQLDLHEGKSKLLFNMYSFGRAQYALILPNGLYAGSPGCESSLYLVLGEQSMDLSAYASWRNRPAEVLTALGGNSDSITALKHTTHRWLQRNGWNPAALPPEPKPGDFPAAVVTRPNVLTEQSSIEIPVKLYATAHDIVQLMVKADDISIPQQHILPDENCKGEREVIVKVPLRAGLNRISITPVDATGVSGKTTSFIVLSQQKESSQLYIVSIGVSDYDNNELDLQYAAKDAKDMAHSLSQGAGTNVHQLILTDKEVSNAGVLEKVSNFLSTASIQDRVIVYMAGHGVLDSQLDYYFAPSSFNPEQISETGISMDKLIACIKETPARHRLLMLDTCHSGLMSEESETKLAMAQQTLPAGVRATIKRGMQVRDKRSPLTSAQRKRYIEEMFSLGSNDLELNMISAADGAGYALESEQWQNGVCAASVMHILNNAKDYDSNKNGNLSVHELQSAVGSIVNKWTGGQQNPSGIIIPNSDMSVASIQSSAPPYQGASESLYQEKGRTFENEAEDILDKYMMFCCTGNKHLLGYLFADSINYKNEKKIMTASEYLDDFETYKEKWSLRQYEVKQFGFKDENTIEIVYVYVCSDKNGKQTQGCSKTILTINKDLKICEIEEQVSRKKIIPLSPGITKRMAIYNYYDTRHYSEESQFPGLNLSIDPKGRVRNP